MSLFIDLKYVGFVGHRLRNFKKIDTNLFRFSCPICGDSATVKTRTRGYIFMRDQKLRYLCHNCGDSRTLGKFLEEVDPNLAREYRVEKFKDANTTVREKKPVEPEVDANRFTVDASRLLQEKVSKPTTILDERLERLDTLPEDHEAVQYCLDRGIGKKHLRKIYYVDEIRNIINLDRKLLKEKYEKRIRGTEPRIVFPFYNPQGELAAVACRGIRGEELRYITVKLKDEDVLIFGLLDVDLTKDVHVVEGQIDSLFVPNSIAVGGTSMGKLDQIGVPKDKVIAIFDNQPRNPEVCALIYRAIKNGYRTLIWSDRAIGKDINAMSENGVDYMREIRTRVFQGLSAELQFKQWVKCRI